MGKQPQLAWGHSVSGSRLGWSRRLNSTLLHCSEVCSEDSYLPQQLLQTHVTFLMPGHWTVAQPGAFPAPNALSSQLAASLTRTCEYLAQKAAAHPGFLLEILNF